MMASDDQRSKSRSNPRTNVASSALQQEEATLSPGTYLKLVLELCLLLGAFLRPYLNPFESKGYYPAICPNRNDYVELLVASSTKWGWEPQQAVFNQPSSTSWILCWIRGRKLNSSRFCNLIVIQQTKNVRRKGVCIGELLSKLSITVDIFLGFKFATLSFMVGFAI